ncbi:MAG: nucleotidyltransferase domain-containing protein [Planctomycetota bacterium]
MRDAVVSRQEIIDALTVAFGRCPFALAAWLGGSDATGRTDAWSDIDIQVLVDDGREEDGLRLAREVPDAVREELEAISLPGSLEEVEAFLVRARMLFEETLADLDLAARAGGRA